MLYLEAVAQDNSWWRLIILAGLAIPITAILAEKVSSTVLLALITGGVVVGTAAFIARSPIGEAIAERIRQKTLQSAPKGLRNETDAKPDLESVILEHLADSIAPERNRSRSSLERKKLEEAFLEKVLKELIPKTDRSASGENRQNVSKDFPEGIIAIMFTDMENFTELIERGDEEAYRILKRHNNIITESASQWNGRVVKGYGDGFMIAFPSVRRAVYSAISIQSLLQTHNSKFPSDERIRVRVGIDAGEPIREGDDYIGRAVNRAARIADAASGGQIYVSDMVRQLVGPIQDLQYIDRGTHTLKGFKEQQQLFEIGRIEALSHPLDSEIDRGIAELEKRVIDMP